MKNSAFVGALGTLGTGGAVSMITSCKDGGNSSASKPLREPGTYYVPDLVDFATDGKELKAGLIGCGRQGSGITLKFLQAANGVTITALGDVFKERIDTFADTLLKENNINVPESNRFVGLDSYKQVIDSGVDIVILATPPVFRPIHFKYATEKGKHSFLEKPVCVDPTGYRMVIATAKQADANNLCVVTGTQRRHQRCYVETHKKVMDGIIGRIVNGIVFWNNAAQSWRQQQQPEWGDGEAMLRNWSNWKWLSGDHCVEQHLHNVDIFMWFSGVKPKTAVGFGSRQRRLTGDQYDNFSVDFEMENGSHMHSYCRQIFGCSGKIGEIFQGTKGTLALNHDFNIAIVKDLDGNVIWEYDFEAEKAKYKQTDPYVLQFVNWINHIRSEKPVNQAPDTATTNLVAIMGRESAYKGVDVKWEEIIASPIDYMPKDLNLGKMDMSAFTVEIPGKPDARIKV